MSEVKKLSTEAEFAAFADIVIDAYPTLFERSLESQQCLAAELEGLAETEPAISFWGLFRSVRGERRLLGGMRLFDFRMNFLGNMIPVGAVGQVAVGPEHRRQRVGRDLMLFYLRHFQERGTPLTALYPFRPDFYRSMGFGYGTKMSRYRIKPVALPAAGDTSHLRRLDPADREALRACYNHYTHRNHGMIEKIDHQLDQLFGDEDLRITGFEKNGRLEGYVAFNYQAGDTYLTYDLHVQELIFETREALAGLLTCLHTQNDQIRRIIVRTQDEDFHHLLDDPRDGSGDLISPVYHATDVQGVGLMYRIVDVERIFRLLEGRDFGGQTCRVELRVKDEFLPENGGTTKLAFRDGRVSELDQGSCDVAVELDIGALSSLLAGTVTFDRLHLYGLAEISSPTYLDTVSRIFTVARKPICTTSF